MFRQPVARRRWPWIPVFVLFVGIGLMLLSCSHRDQSVREEELVARVGDRRITARDFKLSYEYFSHIPTKKKGFAAKLEQLNRLVQRKLFALEAEERGLDTSPRMQQYLQWYRKKAAIRELYRREIETKIQITEAELRNAFVKSKTRIRARHLYARTPEEAERLLDRLRNGETFTNLAREIFQDSSLANSGGDLGYFTWGDMDENFEKAAYSLQKGEISQPVHSRYGWHIIQVTDIQKDVMLTEMDYASQKSKLKHILRQRKGTRLAIEYVKEIMGPKNVILKGDAFTVLAKEFERAFGKSERLLPPFAPNVFSHELNQISDRLEAHLDDPLLLFEGGFWTVRDLLDRLKNIPITDRPVYRSPKKLSNDIAVLFRDEVLAQIALDKGMDKKPEAKREWQNRWDDALYSKLLSSLLDTIQVNDAEVKQYYLDHSSEFTESAKVNIREIFVRSRKLAEELLARIQGGEDMAKLATQYTQRPWARKQGGEFGYFVKGAHGEIGRIAFDHPLGALVGPITIAGGPPSGGYSIFRILGKRPPRKIPFPEVQEDLKRKLLQQKRESTINRFTAQLQGKFAVTTKPEKLKKIETIDDYGVRPIFLFPVTNF